MKLGMTAELIKNALFNGEFAPFTKNDWYAYCDADEGSLIARITGFDGIDYEVIFSPTGNCQIFTYSSVFEDSRAWEMDLNNGAYMEL